MDTNNISKDPDTIVYEKPTDGTKKLKRVFVGEFDKAVEYMEAHGKDKFFLGFEGCNDIF